MKRSYGVSEIPKEKHMAVIVEKNRYEDGDKFTELDYISFDSKEELEEWLIWNEPKDKYIIAEVQPLVTIRQVRVELKKSDNTEE